MYYFLENKIFFLVGETGNSKENPSVKNLKDIKIIITFRHFFNCELQNSHHNYLYRDDTVATKHTFSKFLFKK